VCSGIGTLSGIRSGSEPESLSGKGEGLIDADKDLVAGRLCAGVGVQHGQAPPEAERVTGWKIIKIMM